MLGYIKQIVAERPDEKFVVVGHHAPSKLSTHEQYANEHIMNGAYSSDLSEFILDRPQIKLWTHGHTHHPFGRFFNRWPKHENNEPRIGSRGGWPLDCLQFICHLLCIKPEKIRC